MGRYDRGSRALGRGSRLTCAGIAHRASHRLGSKGLWRSCFWSGNRPRRRPGRPRLPGRPVPVSARACGLSVGSACFHTRNCRMLKAFAPRCNTCSIVSVEHASPIRRFSPSSIRSKIPAFPRIRRTAQPGSSSPVARLPRLQHRRSAHPLCLLQYTSEAAIPAAGRPP